MGYEDSGTANRLAGTLIADQITCRRLCADPIGWNAKQAGHIHTDLVEIGSELWSTRRDQQIDPQRLNADCGGAVDALGEQVATGNPLRCGIGCREESTQVTEPRCADQSIRHGMEYNVTVGVPDQRWAFGEGPATEVERAARADRMCVITPANPDAASRE